MRCRGARHRSVVQDGRSWSCRPPRWKTRRPRPGGSAAKRQQRKAAQEAERREKAAQAAKRKREEAVAKRERDAATKRAREQAAAKRKREQAAAKRKAAAKRAREQAAAKRKREQAARRKAGAAAKRNGAPTTRRRGASESGRQRKPRRGTAEKSSASVAATSARATARIPNPRIDLGAVQASLGRHRRPLVGVALVALVAGAAGASTLALTAGDDGEARAVRIAAADLSIRMPAGWERAEPQIAGLDWLSGAVGGAASDDRNSALVTGLIREPGAARRGLRALLPDGASGKTVRLGRLEAKRYSNLSLGSGMAGTAYLVHTTGPSLAIVCRSSSATAAGFARQCAEAASTVRLRGERAVSPAIAARRPLLVRRALRTLSAERAAGQAPGCSGAGRRRSGEGVPWPPGELSPGGRAGRPERGLRAEDRGPQRCAPRGEQRLWRPRGSRSTTATSVPTTPPAPSCSKPRRRSGADQPRISPSTSSRFSFMCSSEAIDSRFRRSSGSVFEGRTLKCQSS